MIAISSFPAIANATAGRPYTPGIALPGFIRSPSKRNSTPASAMAETAHALATTSMEHQFVASFLLTITSTPLHAWLKSCISRLLNDLGRPIHTSILTPRPCRTPEASAALIPIESSHLSLRPVSHPLSTDVSPLSPCRKITHMLSNFLTGSLKWRLASSAAPASPRS
jgi:hypothetical protein